MSVVNEQRSSVKWGHAIGLGVAGLVYAYVIWNAVAYLISFAQIGMNGYGWFVLILNVIFPVLIYVVAFVLGRRRSSLEAAALLLAGLGLVAVFTMNVIANAAVSVASFLA